MVRRGSGGEDPEATDGELRRQCSAGKAAVPGQIAWVLPWVSATTPAPADTRCCLLLQGAFIKFGGADMAPQFTQFSAVPHPAVRPMKYAAGMLGGMMGM